MVMTAKLRINAVASKQCSHLTSESFIKQGDKPRDGIIAAPRFGHTDEAFGHYIERGKAELIKIRQQHAVGQDMTDALRHTPPDATRRHERYEWRCGQHFGFGRTVVELDKKGLVEPCPDVTGRTTVEQDVARDTYIYKR